MGKALENSNVCLIMENFKVGRRVVNNCDGILAINEATKTGRGVYDIILLKLVSVQRIFCS